MASLVACSSSKEPIYRPNMSRQAVEAQSTKLIAEKNFVKAMELWKDNVFPEDMTDAEVESEWYRALFEEDCLRLMILLKIKPALVKLGWESDPTRTVKGSPGTRWNAPEETAWKGRTALHVSARRGCIELLNQVLELYNIETSSPSQQMQTEGVDRQVAGSSADCDENNETNMSFKSASGPSHNIENTEGRRGVTSFNDDVVLDASSSQDTPGKSKEVESSPHEEDATGESAGRAGKEAGSVKKSSDVDVREAMSSLSRRNVPAYFSNEEKEKAQQVVSHLKEEVKASKGNWARRAFAGWKRNLGKGAQGHRRENAGAIGSPKPGPKPDLFVAGHDSDVPADTREIVSCSRKDLLDLLVCRDGQYEIDALAIAVIHFNSNLVNLFVYAIGECEDNPYEFEKSSTGPPQNSSGTDGSHRDNGAHQDDGDQLSRLRSASKEVLESLDPADSKCLLEDYAIHHRDSNFLPAEFLEFLFHYSSAPGTGSLMKVLDSPIRTIKRNCRRLLWEKVNSCGDSLWDFVSVLQDGQGRTPAHVAVDDLPDLEEYKEIFVEDWEASVVSQWASTDFMFRVACFFTCSDGAGRTPLYRVAARGGLPILANLFPKSNGIRTKMDSIMYFTLLGDFHMFWDHSATNTRGLSERSINLLHKKNSQENCSVFREQIFVAGRQSRQSPIEAAIIRQSYCRSWPLSETNTCLGDKFGIYAFSLEQDRFFRTYVVTLDMMELACCMEAGSEIIGQMLKNGYQSISKSHEVVRYIAEDSFPDPYIVVKHPFHALHIVAATGKYEVLKMFLDDPNCDPFVEDFQGNSALHYALREPFDYILPSLLDYMSCADLLECRRKSVKRGVLEKEALSERKGCIILLLQTGCEIFKVNQNGEIPYPQGKLSKSVDFLSWWTEKQEKEFGSITNTLNTAMNAISVTATLVATASYIGPLQPPLSYAPDSNNVNQIQYENGWVATFLFCDTLSFYLAIIAIVISLIPSLPVPQQPMVHELQRTRAMMILAVSYLIPSIICVLIAFACSSMAVVSANLVSSRGGRLTIITLSICGPLLLGAFCLFFLRLLYISSPQTVWIKKLYRRTSFGVKYKPSSLERVRREREIMEF